MTAKVWGPAVVGLICVAALLIALVHSASAIDPTDKPKKEGPPPTSYMPVVPKEAFDATVKRMTAAKTEIADKHQALLTGRYDLSDRPATDVKMFRGKAIQGGVRVLLPQGVTWDSLASMTAADI